MEPSPSSSSMKISPLNLMSAIIKGRMDPSNVSSESAAEVATILLENREFIMILTTSIAVSHRLCCRIGVAQIRRAEIQACGAS
ncbi:hypothetical protein SLA2020_347280 [Shorea laevis]